MCTTLFIRCWLPPIIPDSQIRAICCHFVTYSVFNFIKLKCFHKLSVVLMSRKVFLRIQQTVDKLSSCVHGVPSVCCQRDEFIISQCILLQFRKLMKSIALLMLTQFTLYSNGSKLKTIHAVHQFVPYAKSRLAIWDLSSISHSISVLVSSLFIRGSVRHNFTRP